MKKLVRIYISPDGTTVQTLAHPGAERFVRGEAERASHVEPDLPPLRWAFHLLRRAFGDKGRVSGLTRRWPCRWRVNFAPIAGPILEERFTDRARALEREAEWLDLRLREGPVRRR